MTDSLGDYADYVARVVASIEKVGIRTGELVQCDMLNIECQTNQRYDELKESLLKQADKLSEIEHNGRFIAIFQLQTPLTAGQWRITYVELLQPKPTRENINGIDGVFFVTATGIDSFLSQHKDVAFERKGLVNTANPYVELKGTDWAVKFHDRHMGAVIGIEKTFAHEH